MSLPRPLAAAARAAGSAVAHGAHRSVAHTGATTVSAGSLLLHLVIGLGVVLGLVWLCARVLRGRGAALTRRQAPLVVLGRQSLGKGVSVAVVRAGRDAFLVGVSPQRVSRLARVEGFEVDPGAAITSVEITGSEDLAVTSPDDDGSAIPAPGASGVLVPFGPLRARSTTEPGARGDTGLRALVATLRERTVRRA